jgi:hypothetical protein
MKETIAQTGESSEDARPGLPEVRADVEAIVRAPVLTDSDPISPKDINREWRVVSEYLRRSVLDSAEARHALIPFVASPLSETLPNEAVQSVAILDHHLEQTQERMKRLYDILKVPAVPDEAIVPDIHWAPTLLDHDHQVARLSYIKEKYGDDTYDRHLESLAEDKGAGLTHNERQLVELRFRQARDVKLMAFMSELIDQPGAMEVIGDGLVGRTLLSGTKMVMTEEAATVDPNLLNPAHWQGRKMIKDRVYAARVEDREYILKERKTTRHYDTSRKGHVEGLTSAAEFAAAQHFAQLGTVHQEGLDLHWEKPVGYVEFPDGYQFCVFVSEDKLEKASVIKQPEIAKDLALAVMEVPELYQEEYEQVKEQAAALHRLSDSAEASFERRQHKPVRHHAAKLKAVLTRTEKPVRYDELTFEEFAYAKGAVQRHLLPIALFEAITSEGYVNTDDDGFSLRVVAEPGKRPVIDVTMFDFERYETAEHAEERWPQMLEYQKDNLRRVYTINNILRWERHTPSNGQGNRSIYDAAMTALLQREGTPQDEPRL